MTARLAFTILALASSLAAVDALAEGPPSPLPAVKPEKVGLSSERLRRI